MSNSARIRVGVIGCGTVAQTMHLPYLRSLPDQFEINALSDLSPELLESLGNQYGVPKNRQFEDYRALLDSDVDAVLVLTNGSHTAPVLAAAAAGKHLLVEKPLCFTTREADDIEKAVARSGVQLMVGYMKRFDPGFQRGTELVRQLDDLRYAQINTLHPNEEQYFEMHGVERFGDVPAAAAKRSRQEHEALLDEAVGGSSDTLRFIYFDVFLSSMVHDVNALRALVGDVNSVLFTEVWPADSHTPSVTTMLQHPGDLRTIYTWSYLGELRDYFEEIAVMSPAERVRIQFPSPFLKHFPTPVVDQRMHAGAMVESRIEVSHQEAFQEELRAFHKCVTTREHPLTDVKDARADVELLQRIFAAFDPAGLGGEAEKFR